MIQVTNKATKPDKQKDASANKRKAKSTRQAIKTELNKKRRAERAKRHSLKNKENGNPAEMLDTKSGFTYDYKNWKRKNGPARLRRNRRRALRASRLALASTPILVPCVSEVSASEQ